MLPPNPRPKSAVTHSNNCPRRKRAPCVFQIEIVKYGVPGILELCCQAFCNASINVLFLSPPVESTPIGAKLHTVYDPILVFECKRLPAPSTDREREYVTGGEALKSGGLQRFKLGLHGANLAIAAMIGYVQRQSSRHWHERINGWISELVSDAAKDTCDWSSREVLGPLEEDASKGIARCRSIHSRGRQASRKEILIYHLWVTMTTRN